MSLRKRKERCPVNLPKKFLYIVEKNGREMQIFLSEKEKLLVDEMLKNNPGATITLKD